MAVVVPVFVVVVAVVAVAVVVVAVVAMAVDDRNVEVVVWVAAGFAEE